MNQHIFLFLFAFLFVLSSCSDDSNSDTVDKPSSPSADTTSTEESMSEIVTDFPFPQKLYVVQAVGGTDYTGYVYQEPCGPGTESVSFLNAQGREMIVWNYEVADPLYVDSVLKTGEGKYDIMTSFPGGFATVQMEKTDEPGIWIYIAGDHETRLLDSTKLSTAKVEPCTDVKAIFGELPSSLLSISRNDQGKFEIIEDCMYGVNALAFDENGEWMEFSGGGDAYGRDVISAEKLFGKTVIKAFYYVSEDTLIYTISSPEFGIYDVRHEGATAGDYYVDEEYTSNVIWEKPDCEDYEY